MKANECLKCGASLVYFLGERDLACVECGKTFRSNAACKNGHYICDACHAKLGIKAVRACAASVSRNPLEILEQALLSPYVHMHGPEHHVLVGAALITAYHNAGGDVDLSKALKEMKSRGSKYPGGSCGFWGCCGAAVSTGMYLSIITETTPLSSKTWGWANRITSLALGRMADLGGPRCCKRNSFVALETAVAYTKEILGVEMELPRKIRCTHYPKNAQCLRKACPYFPA